jgi:hypothetical protein
VREGIVVAMLKHARDVPLSEVWGMDAEVGTSVRLSKPTVSINEIEPHYTLIYFSSLDEAWVAYEMLGKEWGMVRLVEEDGKITHRHLVAPGMKGP